MFNLPQSDSKVSVYFTLDGKEYQLSQFNIGFTQATDIKGEPQNRVRGGCMTVTLTEMLPNSIYDWAMRPGIKKSGEVSFRKESESPSLKIEFHDAYCIGFFRSVDSMGGGTTTVLTISPLEISANGVSFYNHWTETN